MFRLLLGDLKAKARWSYERDDWNGIARAIMADGTPAMIVYRLMQWARKRRLTPLEFLFNKINTVFCNCIIGRGAEFGAELVFIHSTGIVINGSVVGGTGVMIEHQVTIGSHDRKNPRLGDRVFIGAGAKIIGPVSIGDRARVGANAVVVHDVPPDSTVVGVPAKVVRRRDALHDAS
jgi:serine O-acetyltransferase